MFSEEELKHFYDRDSKSFVEDFEKLTEEEIDFINDYYTKNLKLTMH